jgi:hypothetical protein
VAPSSRWQSDSHPIGRSQQGLVSHSPYKSRYNCGLTDCPYVSGFQVSPNTPNQLGSYWRAVDLKPPLGPPVQVEPDTRGHVSKEMLELYSHIRTDAKVQASQALAATRARDIGITDV